MRKKGQRIRIWAGGITILLLLLSLTAATYAWFSSNRLVDTDRINARSGTSELKLLAAVSAQQLDVILMDTAARDQLQGEEYFLDLRTLDADFSSLDELSADGVTLDISDTPLIAQAGFEESVYLGVIANAPHPERAAAYIRYLLK